MKSGNFIGSRFVNFPVTWIYVEVFCYNRYSTPHLLRLLLNSSISSIPKEKFRKCR